MAAPDFRPATASAANKMNARQQRRLRMTTAPHLLTGMDTVSQIYAGEGNAVDINEM